MKRTELRTLLLDYLDGLLDDDAKAAAEDCIAKHPDVLAEVARFRAVLYRPYPVAPPSPGLEASIRLRTGRRFAWRWVRYAAMFAAGVLTTLVVQAGVRPSAPPVVAPVEQPDTTVADAGPTYNRRIR